MSVAERAVVHDRVLDWYAANGRDLPWRHPECEPWGVFVSEVMAQQTPIARIVQPWQRWLERWPTPADLAGAPVADAIRMWDRLGYPRRAVNLHAAARAMVERHNGQVPSDPVDLLALPGVGDYTAAAVASFAFTNPLPVVDTNVRRVLARVSTGVEQAAPALTRAEKDLAAAWLPADRAAANRWNVAVMELGALVCSARKPDCERCPVLEQCAWNQVGRPAYTGARRRPQGYAGTDREVRGAILARVREGTDGVVRADLDDLASSERLDRLLGALIADGLLACSNDRYDLPR